jgi:hypothetical protein
MPCYFAHGILVCSVTRGTLALLGTAHLGGLLKFHHVAFGVHADLALKGAKVVGVIEF